MNSKEIYWNKKFLPNTIVIRENKRIYLFIFIKFNFLNIIYINQMSKSSADHKQISDIKDAVNILNDERLKLSGSGT